VPQLFNISICLSELPEEWKAAHVLPINPSCMIIQILGIFLDNISMLSKLLSLSMLSKLLEKDV